MNFFKKFLSVLLCSSYFSFFNNSYRYLPGLVVKAVAPLLLSSSTVVGSILGAFFSPLSSLLLIFPWTLDTLTYWIGWPFQLHTILNFLWIIFFIKFSAFSLYLNCKSKDIFHKNKVVYIDNKYLIEINYWSFSNVFLYSYL